VIHRWVRRDTFICAMWFVDRYEFVTHWFVWCDSSLGTTWLIPYMHVSHMNALHHAYEFVTHSFIARYDVTHLSFHICMSHIYMHCIMLMSSWLIHSSLGTTWLIHHEHTCMSHIGFNFAMGTVCHFTGFARLVWGRFKCSPSFLTQSGFVSRILRVDLWNPHSEWHRHKSWNVLCRESWKWFLRSSFNVEFCVSRILSMRKLRVVRGILWI